MRRISIFIFLFLNILIFNSCKEDIDESNLYTFTGETIEDYLENRSEQYSNFNYILKRIGYDKILAAYGTYTCFAPDNEAVMSYIDSLYNDDTNKDLPHNGMTGPGLEGLTDSLCQDIALFHLLSTEVMSVYMGNGMTVKTMLGREITTSFDSISKSVAINRDAKILKEGLDVDLENGVLHEISHVITRSNQLIAGEMEAHPDIYSLFSDALKATGLADTLTETSHSFGVIEKSYGFYVPEKCEVGYTIFAETDDVLKAKGINSVKTMAEYADSIYGNCQEWYDYVRNNNITISRGTDYKNPWNVLNMFLRYHVLKYKIPYDKLTNHHNEVSKVTLVEYYETMLPYTLVKVTKNGSKLMLNRWEANTSLTNQVAELGTKDMHTVLFEGVELAGQKSQIAPTNGYIHPIKGMLVYNKDVPRGALNERMRFDDTVLFGEMMSNSFRRITDAEVKALNGGKEGSFPAAQLSGNYICIPPDFFQNLKIYNGASTLVLYLPGQSSGWSNYQGDELMGEGNYDFAMRLPPVPDGTYELRMGYTAEAKRGMVQIYMGTSSDLSSMKAVDIPLDMRIISANNANGNPDVYTGWCNWSLLDDKGVESDANMRNLGYMRGPLYYTVGVNSGNYARNNPKDLRRIIYKGKLDQGEHWLRFKSVLDDNSAQFHLDYIELCPENVYNSTTYVEDMY